LQGAGATVSLSSAFFALTTVIVPVTPVLVLLPESGEVLPTFSCLPPWLLK
jgi:hypothetical protein